MAEITQVDGQYQISYQPKNPQTGEAYGPPQLFRDPDVQKLLLKVANAHESAAVAFYEARNQVRAERVMNPDQGRPIRQFASRQLTADERIKIANLRKDPNTAIDAARIEMEALLGAPLEDILGQLNQVETDRIADIAKDAVSIFIEKNPSYIECDINKEAMEGFLLKKEFPVTVKNLQIAFDTLSEQKKLALRDTSTPEVVPAAIPTATPSGEPASASAAPISATPTTAPRTASTGLSARDSSAPQNAPAPAAVGLTHRDVAKMSAADIAKLLSDPEATKQLDALAPRPEGRR